MSIRNLLGFLVVLVGCGSTQDDLEAPAQEQSGSAGDAGAASSAGDTAGAPGSASCQTFEPCGGDLTGVWFSESACITTDLSPTDPCTIAVSQPTAKGATTLIFRADGSYSASGSYVVASSGTVKAECVPGGCAAVSMCSEGPFRDSCSCKVEAPLPLAAEGTFRTEGAILTRMVAGVESAVPYCVRGSRLTFRGTTADATILWEGVKR